MKQKLEFVVAITIDERTRMLRSERELSAELKDVVASFVRQYTAGSIPKVEVRLVRRPGQEVVK